MSQEVDRIALAAEIADEILEARVAGDRARVAMAIQRASAARLYREVQAELDKWKPADPSVINVDPPVIPPVTPPRGEGREGARREIGSGPSPSPPVRAAAAPISPSQALKGG